MSSSLRRGAWVGLTAALLLAVSTTARLGARTASQVAFAPQLAGTGTAGGFAVVQAAVEDDQGAVVTAGIAQMTLTIAGPGALNESLTSDSANGIATFWPTLTRPGAYTFTVSAPGLAPTSSPVTITSDGAVFGPQAVSQSTSVAQVEVDFSAPATVANIAVFTKSVQNLDFGPGSSDAAACVTGAFYAAGQSCTVGVVFSPVVPGARSGAVVLTDQSGATIATAPLSGVGLGADAAYGAGSAFSMLPGASAIAGLAADDEAVTAYVSTSNSIVRNVTYSGPATMATTSQTPGALAVDGTGHVYAYIGGLHAIAVLSSNAANVDLDSAPATTFIGAGLFWQPTAMAFDASGNLFVADGGTLIEIPRVGGALQPDQHTSTSFNCFGLAFDASGNLWTTDPAGNTVSETPLENGTLNFTHTRAVLSGRTQPQAIAVDANGSVYLGEPGVGVSRIPNEPNGLNPADATLISGGAQSPAVIALGPPGYLYVGDNAPSHPQALLVNARDPQNLSFQGPAGQTLGPLSEILFNVGNTPLTVQNITVPDGRFSLQAGGCQNAQMLPGGGSCLFTATFQSAAVGTVNADVSVTTDAGNEPNPQVIPLSATTSALNTTLSIVQSASSDPHYGQNQSVDIDVTNGTNNHPGGSYTIAVDANAPVVVPVSMTGPISYGLGALLPATHSITVTYGGDAGNNGTTSTFFLQVFKANPQYQVNAPAPYTYGTPSNIILTFQTSGSQQPPSGGIDYQIDGGAQPSQPIIQGPSRANLPLPASLTAGTHTVTWTYGGDGNFNAASGTPIQVTVTPATVSVSWNPAPNSITYGTALTAGQNPLNASAAGNLAGTFRYTFTRNSDQQVTTIITGQGPVTLGAGSYTAQATFLPTDPNYAAGSSGTVGFTVNQATPQVSWNPNPTSITYPATVSVGQGALNANVTNGIAGSFSFKFTANSNGAITTVTSASGAVTLAAGGYTLQELFTPTDQTDDNSQSSGTIGFTVNKANQTITFTLASPVTYSTTPVTLTATASSGLAVSYSASGAATVSGNQLTMTTTGTASVTASQSGNSNYNAASNVQRSLTINGAPAALKFLNSAFPPIYAGNPMGTVGVQTIDQFGHAVSSPSVAVTLTVTGPNGFAATLNGSTSGSQVIFNNPPSLVLPSDGTYTLTATSAGLTPASASFQAYPQTYSFQSEPVGTAAPVQNVTFVLGGGTTVASVGVVAQGAVNEDFTIAGSTNCIGTFSGVPVSCTVPVQFSPAGVGVRQGAVVLYDASHNPIKFNYLSGTGQGAVLRIPGLWSTNVGFASPAALALDGSGNLFIADTGNNRVAVVPNVSGALDWTNQTTITLPTATNASTPTGLVVDGMGNLAVADAANNRVVVFINVNGTLNTANPITIASTGLSSPAGLAFDTAGNLYVADTNNDRVVSMFVPGNSPTLTTVYGSAGLKPTAVAFDPGGNLLIVGTGSASIIKVPNVGGALNPGGATTIGSGFVTPEAIATDAAGEIYVTDAGRGASSGIYLSTGAEFFQSPSVAGMAVSWTGALYFTSGNTVLTYPQAPSAFTFPATPVGQSSIANQPSSKSVGNVGNQPMHFTNITFDADFTDGGSSCTTSLSLAPAGSCLFHPKFMPSTATAITGAITFAVDAANAQSGSFEMNGTGTKGAPTVTVTGGTSTYDGAAHGAMCAVTGANEADLGAGTLSYSTSDGNAPAHAGSYTATCSFAGDDNYNSATGTATVTITQRTLNITATASNKVYDGGTTASVSLVDDRVAGDTLTVTAGAATFSDKNVGNGKTVTVSGITVGGSGGGDYTLALTTVTAAANITPRTLAIAATASNKTYDGTTAATVTLADNRVTGDVLTTTFGSATFADKNTGSGKTVTVSSITVSGADAANYALASGSVAATANITPRTLTVTASAPNKTYDGTTAATATFIDDRVAGDTLTISDGSATFGDKNVGTGKTVTVSGLAITGADAGNYQLAAPTVTATASITARTLTVTASASDKVYDGTTAATVILADDRVSGDALTLTYASATFADGNVASGKTVTVSGLLIGGADGGDYQLASFPITTTASITVRTLNATAAAVSKAYDATTTASVTVTSDHTAFDLPSFNYTSASFADKNVGTGKIVTVTGLTINGNDANNYQLASTTLTATADITPSTLVVTVHADPKHYDGTTAATVTLVDNRAAGDVLTIGYASATFSDKNVADAKTVTVSGLALSGPDAANYSLAATTLTTTSFITQYTLTVTAAAEDKTYDGTTAATITLSDNRIPGDALTVGFASEGFDYKDAGLDRSVEVKGLTLSGADAGNYVLALNNISTSANINRRTLDVTATATNRPYDGSTTAAVTLSDDRVSGDVLTVTYASATFADKASGTGKTVTVSGLAISGFDADNYQLGATSATTTANIGAAILTVTATASNKTYDGTTSATVALADNRAAGDQLSISYASATFANKNVAVGKLVTVSNITVSGQDAGDYQLSSTTATATATIGARSLTVVAGGIDKIYDGTTTAQVTLADNRVPQDQLTITALASFGDPSIGTGKLVTALINVTGLDSGNYIWNTTATTTANILAPPPPPNPYPFGAVVAGQSSSPVTMTLTSASSAPVARAKVVTQGIEQLDFTGTSTCTTNSCTITVTFAPTAVGARFGAVLLLDANNNVLTTEYLTGTGLGSQATFQNTPVATLSTTGFALTLDAKNDLFVCQNNHTVVAYPSRPDGTLGSPITVMTSVATQPGLLAIDGAGNLMVNDGHFFEIPSITLQAILSGGRGPATVDSSGTIISGGFYLSFPVPNFGNVLVSAPHSSMTFDAAGDLFFVAGSLYEIVNRNGVLDTSNTVFTGGGNLGGDPPPVMTKINSTGTGAFYYIAFDASGNLFISQSSNIEVDEVPVVNGVLNYAGTFPIFYRYGNYPHLTNTPSAIGFDPAGDMYLSFQNAGGALWRVPYQNGSFNANAITTVMSGLLRPRNVNIDGNGTLYVADDPGTGSGQAVYVIAQGTPPTLSFAGESINGVMPTIPSQTVTALNSGNQPLPIGTVASEARFPTSGTCAGGATVPPGGTCALTVAYQPTATGSVVGSVVMTEGTNTFTPAQALTAEGTIVAQGALTLGPSALSIGDVVDGATSAPATLELVNGTTSNVNAGGVTFPGGANGFSVKSTTCTSTLAPGTACVIQVTFTATKAGGATATIQVAGTTASLFANGADWSTDALNFGTVTWGSSSGPLTVKVFNLSNSIASVSNIQLGGFSAPYSFTAQPTGSTGQTDCQNVPALGSCTIAVTFSPPTNGYVGTTLNLPPVGFTAYLNFTANGNTHTAAVELSGVAVNPGAADNTIQDAPAAVNAGSVGLAGGGATVTVAFGGVTASGVTTVVAEPESVMPPLPSAFEVSGASNSPSLPLYVDVTTSATTAGPYTVCFTLSGTYTQLLPLQVLHYEHGAWVPEPLQISDPVTGAPLSNPNAPNPVLCVQTTSLSPFAIARHASIGTFVAFSQDFTWLRANSTVTSGNVGANESRAMTGHTHIDDGDSDDVTVLVGVGATMAQPGSVVVGDTVNLKTKASVYNVADNYSLFNKNSSVLGATTRPGDLPFYASLPAFPTITAGTNAMYVAKNATLTLAHGNYGAVHVDNGGTLILTGGLYQLLSLDVDQNATVQFEAATDLRVSTEVHTLARSKLIVDSSVAALRASNIVISVGGDDTCGVDDADADGDDAGPVSVQVGSNSVVQANIYAAKGTVWLKSGTTATGAFIGMHVRIGINVTLTLDSIFK